MVDAIGADSNLLKRGNIGQFIADMGLAVASSANDLLQKYDDALNPVFRNYRVKRQERMINLNTLKSTLGVPMARQITRDFVRGIMTEISEVVFCYSAFPTKKIPYTWIYTQDPVRKKLDIVKFVNMIQAGYALFAAHFYRTTSNRPVAVMLDHFDFPITRAWEELSRFPDVSVHVRGDLCNPRISLADVLLDLVECDLWKLNRPEIVKTLTSLCPGVTVRVKCLTELDVMRPLTRTQTDFSQHIAHPVVFLAKEGLPGEGRMLETTPLMFAARNMACQLGGCAKIFEPGATDQRLIARGDYFVHRGPVGKGIVKMLRTAGHDIIEWNQHDLLSKYSL